jgi:selenocysteine lyase/cysteine desulfurase
MEPSIEPLAPENVFEPDSCYFDTPTYGLAPERSFEAVVEAAHRWRAGRATMAEYDEAVDRSRGLFAQIVGVDASRVAIGANVSSLVGPVAAGLPPGSKILIPVGEFTSLLFPFLVNRDLDVSTVPLEEFAGSIDDSFDVVAFSLVQSSTGEVADIQSILEATLRCSVRTLVDATHAVGWLPFDPRAFDFVFVAAYKWLLCPRGVAFMTMHSDLAVPPTNAGWYSGEDPWASIYGEPLRLATSARRFDTSPAWIPWVGAVPSLELIASLGVETIHAHDVALANAVRMGMGMDSSDSAIVTLAVAEPERLADAGIKASVRASSVRIGCHVHNSSSDVDALLAVLADEPPGAVIDGL